MPFDRRRGKESFRFEKTCKFIGSLAISLLKGNERQAFVNEKLLEMKDVGKGISIVLHINEEGVKVFKDDKSAVKMAHGITKVLFSTCHPDQKLFAYVVKAPAANGKIVTQAHMFKTNKSKHTQELSSSISRAFKIAYSKNTLKRQNQVDQFEKDAENNMEIINSQKKRWAKGELAHGHDNAAHALRAKGYKSTRNDEPPSKAILKLVKSLDKGTKSKQDSSQQEKILHDPRNDRILRKLSPAKILPMSGEEFSSGERIAKSRNRRFSSEENFRKVVKDNSSPTVSQEKELDDFRTVSGENVLLDDQEIMRGKLTNTHISSNFAAPISKFGTVEEHKPITCSHSIAKPISKFGDFPANSEDEHNIHEETDEEGDEKVDWEYINIAQNKPPPPLPAATGMHETNQDEQNIITTPVTEIENGNGKVKQQSRRKKLKDIPVANRMTLSEEQILKDSEWYQPGFSRSIAEEILQNRPVGSFFVRDSTSHPGSFVMTMKVGKLIKETQSMNYLIVKDRDGLYKIKGFSNIFPGLTYLVAHYSSIEEDIPCRLILSSDNPLFGPQGGAKDDGKGQLDENELDYLLLDEDCDDQDYINFSSNADICRELDLICFE